MKKRFLGIVCLLYSILTFYVYFKGYLGNYLAPQMQAYILISSIVLIFIGFVVLFNNHIHYKFKVIDIVLVIPLVMFVFAGNGELSLSLASNRSSEFFNSFSNEVIHDSGEVEDVQGSNVEEDVTNSENVVYDFSDVEYDIVDEAYAYLANAITFNTNPKSLVGKRVRVRGFTLMDVSGVGGEYFAIGKYIVSCCAADASFGGFVVSYDKSKIKNNAWYEIEGVIKVDNTHVYIDAVNVKEIDGSLEEMYVYPCYAYDDGECAAVKNYDIE